MSTRLQRHSAAVASAEAQLSAIQQRMQAEVAQASSSVGSGLTPSQRSSVVAAGANAGARDPVEVATAFASAVPALATAVAQTPGGAATAARLSRLTRALELSADQVRAARARARQLASAEIRVTRANAAAQQAADALQGLCPPPSNPHGRQGGLPASDGTWVNPNDPGNCDWHPDATTTRGAAVLAATGGQDVPFRAGYPQFSTWVYVHQGSPARVQIAMTGQGRDFTLADAEMRRRDPSWVKPAGWTWHHVEDGTTMELVPRGLNNSLTHDGGRSFVQDASF